MTRVRHLVHRGSVLASGFVLDVRLVPEATARARILGIASAVMDVRRAGDLLIVRLRRPVRVDCATALGAPLVVHGSLWAAMPLDPDELRSLESGVESIVLASGGELVRVPLADTVLEDISQWLDVSSFAVHEDAVSLGEMAGSPASRWVPVSEDVRKPLGVEPLAKEGRAFLASLESSSSEGAARAPRALPRWLTVLWRAFAWFMTSRATSDASAAPARSTKEAAWFDRVRTWFEGAAVRLLTWARLAPLVGRRHAEYLGRLFEMFESNDLEGALRHAIPLGSALEGALKAKPALTTPSPRTELAIVPERGLASTALQLGGDLFDALRQTYRRAFERLVAQGDIEKAAFVLAELLQSNEEAVSFLERHGRWTLAAEIAEARNLSPGLVVRQWFLAGNRDRAVRVARRTGAFAEAVSRLESSHAEEARALRLVWADTLASSGAYAAAVDVAWPVEAARGLVRAWIERAIAVGGTTGAKMLVRKLHIAPDAFAEVRDRVLALVAEEEAGTWLARAIGMEVLSGAPREDTRVLAKIAARALLPCPPDLHGNSLVDRLVERASDPVFVADVKPRVVGPVHQAGGDVQVQAFALTDAGALRMHNEDLCIATTLLKRDPPCNAMHLDVEVKENPILLGAFDGLNGASSGDVASRLAAVTIADVLYREIAGLIPDTEEALAYMLRRAIESANEALIENATKPEYRGTGCAATVATLHKDTLLVAQIGDTRGYILRAGKLVPITKEHSLLNAYIAAGKLTTPEEIEAFPHKNVIVRALGMKEDTVADIERIPLCRADIVLLCSDGVWRVIDDATIRAALTDRPPREAAHELLRAVNAAGAPDNVSIVVAQITGDGLPLPQGDPTASPCSLPTLREPRIVQRSQADVGAYSIHDAAELPDGRLLVALGEVGVWLLSPHGKVLTRFREPADHLVLSDHGDRAILVAYRGGACRLARLDLVARKVQTWCDVRLDHWADTFDGAVWYTQADDAIFAIDVLSSQWEHLWEMRHRDILSISRSEKQFSVWSVQEKSQEIWTFEEPSRTLRRRNALPDSPSGLHLGISPAGRAAAWQRTEPSDDIIAHIYDGSTWHALPLTSTAPEMGWVHNPKLSDDWIAFGCLGGSTLHIYDLHSREERAVIQFDGAKSGAARFQGNRAILFDDCGRVLILCCESGRILREFRIS